MVCRVWPAFDMREKNYKRFLGMKHLRKVTALAAAAVLAVPLSLGALSGCSRDNGSGNISVYIFCSDAEKVAYQSLIDTWRADYAEQLRQSDPEKFGEDFTIEVDLSNVATSSTYFENVGKYLNAGNAADILYVSPSMVQSYVSRGYILDLSDRIDYSQYDITDLWGDALGRYAYNENDGTIGISVEYDEATDAFYQNGDKTKEVGIYALPKDYSSFSYVYNANFFSRAFKDAYEQTTDKFGAVYQYGTTPDDGGKPWESQTAKPSAIINPGTTVTYYPFNFYNYYTLKDAYEAKDPVAVMSVTNGGYDVTIPGYPDETFVNGTDDSSTQYDDSVGYMVYTYSEFSAISFAVSYYVTAYDSQRGVSNNKTTGKVEADDYPAANDRYKLASWLDGQNIYGVYANDQYDRETFYLTTWLAGNDASIISDDYRTITAPAGQEATSSYGMNSTKFIETFAAFSAYSSDWVGNMYFSNSKLDATIAGQGGYVGLTSGFNVFYGYGTWDTSRLDTNKDVLNFQVMATPVSDSYSLYTRYKDMNYNEATAGTSASGGTFTEDQIKQSLAARQDQWGARMDSVGFGVNSRVTRRYTGANAWKQDAAISLCAYLTIDPDAQVSLTYAGSQLPNYVSQSADYLNTTGTFADMITPDDEEWATYYPVAAAIASVKGALVTKNKVSDWMAQNGYEAFVDDINPLYANATFGDVNGSMSYAFRMFNMISLNKNSRNLLIRMAETNGVADPCTYTYNDEWWSQTFMTYEGNYLFAVNIEDGGYSKFSKNAISSLSTSGFNPTTPYNYCIALTPYGEARLQESLLNLQ